MNYACVCMCVFFKLIYTWSLLPFQGLCWFSTNTVRKSSEMFMTLCIQHLIPKDQKACTVIRWKWHIEHRSFAGKKQTLASFWDFSSERQIDINLDEHSHLKVDFKPGFFAVCGRTDSQRSLWILPQMGEAWKVLLLGAPFCCRLGHCPMWMYKV